MSWTFPFVAGDGVALCGAVLVCKGLCLGRDGRDPRADSPVEWGRRELKDEKDRTGGGALSKLVLQG